MPKRDVHVAAARPGERDTSAVPIIAACGVLVVAGLLAVVRWGGGTVEAPRGPGPTRRITAGEAARGYLWWLTVAVAAGVGAGLVTGAGGRLVMRLLAVTSPDARGRITEADEVVGVVSGPGTVALILFGGVLFGLLSVVPYLLIRRWLPPGRLGGFVFGVLLLLVASTRLEPLRPNNVDFSIVGPGWLALSTFGLLVVVHGMLLAALAARFGASLPLLATPLRVNGWGAAARYWPLLVLAFLPLAAVAVVVGIAVVLGSRLWPGPGLARSHGALVAGRVALGAAAVASLPSFASAVGTILAAY